MDKTITIQSVRGIAKLRFKMPGAGVYLLSGSNGSGKTTLLACLRRIGQANAFQIHFATSQHAESLDSFAESKITYSIDDRSVTYSYAGERWVPRPRAESDLISEFGYPDVRYAGATASRITPRSEDFKPARAKLAPLALREAANAIFETDRFSTLKTINVTTGNGNQAFVLQARGGSNSEFISERNFSLGELCVLKLLREIAACRNGSLVLIDELELALHPRAQIGLFKYLEGAASDRSLTVIVSTHSVTLLKRTPRHRIMFLEQRDSHTAVLNGCFPAYSLGSLSLDEERIPDVVIYVEDEAARSVVDSLVKLAITERYAGKNDVFPTARVVPIGDFKNVVRFYDRTHAMLPEQVKQWIVLDKDVEEESVDIMSHSNNNAMRDVFHRHNEVIRYLPWTPEVGLIELLSSTRQDSERQLKAHYANAHIRLSSAMLVLTDSAVPAEKRNEAKRKVRRLISNLSLEVGAKEDVVRDRLYAMLAEHYFTNHKRKAMQLMGSLVS